MVEGIRSASVVFDRPMSVVGQSRHSDGGPLTSGLSRQTNILTVRRHVSNVPFADIVEGSGRVCVPILFRLIWSNVSTRRFADRDCPHGNCTRTG
jgi:hypothetical protein